MEQNGPPSPAPSNDDIYPNGLHHLIRPEGATSYPREHLHPSDMGGMQTPSRYGTPGPQQDMQYDHHSPYSHRPHDGQMVSSPVLSSAPCVSIQHVLNKPRQSYSHGYDTSVSSIYGPMSGELSHQVSNFAVHHGNTDTYMLPYSRTVPLTRRHPRRRGPQMG